MPELCFVTKKFIGDEMHKYIIISISILLLLLTACNKSTDSDDSDSVFKKGEWEFTWYNPSPNTSLVLLGFVGGQLKQSGNTVCYDSDCILNGPISGSSWSGVSKVNGGSGFYSFSGNFSGNPATTFEGSWTLPNSSQTGRMTGSFIK